MVIRRLVMVSSSSLGIFMSALGVTTTLFEISATFCLTKIAGLQVLANVTNIWFLRINVWSL